MRKLFFLLSLIILLIVSSTSFAETWDCYYDGPNNSQQKMTFERMGDEFIVETGPEDLPAKIVYETNQFLTLISAYEEYALTFIIDKNDKYFEAAQIQLKVKRPLDKIKGKCFLF
jgi:hypothetical protein